MGANKDFPHHFVFCAWQISDLRLGNSGPVLETGQMSSVETGQMSAVETGQMSAAETGQMSAVETRQMSTIETGQQTSHSGLRRPRQRPTKSMTTDPWLAEAAIAVDQ